MTVVWTVVHANWSLTPAAIFPWIRRLRTSLIESWIGWSRNGPGVDAVSSPTVLAVAWVHVRLNPSTVPTPGWVSPWSASSRQRTIWFWLEISDAAAGQLLFGEYENTSAPMFPFKFESYTVCRL